MAVQGWSRLCQGSRALGAVGAGLLGTEDTLLGQEGKVLGDKHPLCLQSLCLGRWLCVQRNRAADWVWEQQDGVKWWKGSCIHNWDLPGH